MNTIERILKKNNTTREKLKLQKEMGINNGCGGKGGFNISKRMHKFDNYNDGKGKKLADDFDIICGIHDFKFKIARKILSKDVIRGIKMFFKANYELLIDAMDLLHWTSIFTRAFIALLLMSLTNTIGIIYFLKS